MICLNSLCYACLEKLFQAFVLERLNHRRSVACCATEFKSGASLLAAASSLAFCRANRIIHRIREKICESGMDKTLIAIWLAQVVALSRLPKNQPLKVSGRGYVS